VCAVAVLLLAGMGVWAQTCPGAGCPSPDACSLIDSASVFYELNEVSGPALSSAPGGNEPLTVGAGVSQGQPGRLSGVRSTRFFGQSSPQGLYTYNASPRLPVGASTYTVAGWARMDIAGSSKGTILFFGRKSGPNTCNALRLASSNSDWINYWWGCDKASQGGTVQFTDRQWHHVAVTWDPINERRFYVDGIQLPGTSPATSTQCVPAINITGGTNGLSIGSANHGQWQQDETWSGWLSEVGVWPRALQQSEIRMLVERVPGSVCPICSAGFYRNVSTCLACAPGSFSNRTGNTACSVCPAGAFSSSGASSCSVCAAGSYSTPGSPACSVCAAGTFSGNGSASCTRCTVGQVAPAGSSQCTACPEGTVADSTQASCLVCTAGSAVSVSVTGAQYTGPNAAALGSAISVSATVPYVGSPLSDPTDQVQASVTFDGPGMVPCTATAALQGAEFTAQCIAAVPVSGGSNGIFPLTVSFVYQKNWCTKYIGSVTSVLALVDVGRVATVADAAAAGVAAEVVRASAVEAALRTDLTTEATVRAQSDAVLTTAVRNEMARAVSAEGALAFNLSLVSSRVGALEVAEPSFLFRGLQSGIEVSYPNGQQPGTGIASMLNYPLRFDAPLSARGSAIRYNSTTGVVSIVQPGSYRLDAFVHLYSAQGASVVGTGVVAWMSVGAAAPQPIGPNLLNPNAMGVPQGTVGDITFVSTLLNVPEGTSLTAPFHAQCVLVSMNQRKNQITDASVISVTKLK